MEKLWNTLKTGLVDYCKTNGFRDVVLGLSGGLDSAVVSVLASQALGKEHVHTLMMKTNHTSQLSLDIANEIHRLNGFNYQMMDIQDIYDGYVNFLRNKMLEAPKKNVMENIQARIRGQILMAYSNQFNYLVLSCSNRSESLMGYCTLYGDTCGGLSPLGNVFKSTIFELARWLNTQKYVLPNDVITRAPSAELSDGQKDEDSLPQYDILDGILRLHCDDQKTTEQIIALGYDKETVEWVVKQYNKTAFKRIQMPPALSLGV